MGSRLKPLTEEVPKCLTELNGEPILLNTLKILEKNGVQDCAIIVGHLADVIKKTVGGRVGNMAINYRLNKTYKENNSMYSAWLARDYLEQGCFMIEGDCVFEEALIRRAIQFDEEKTCWVLDKFTEEYFGSMSITDKEGRIIDLKIVREKLPEYSDNYFKSTGILKITPKYGKLLSKWLDDDVKAGNVNIYYDFVIAKHLKEEPIYACNITGSKWAEIDDFDDVRKAEKILSSMKFVVIVLDGATDHLVKELGGKTPLEVACIPHINNLARWGKTGFVRTMHPGLPIESMVAALGLIGYNPARYYPNGRASFEALAQEIYLKEEDIAFRCNLISLDGNKIKDFTADNIPTEDAFKIIEGIEVNHPDMELYAGQSYRSLLVFRNAKFKARKLIAHEPHHNIGASINNIMLEYPNEEGKEQVEMLNKFLLDSRDQIRMLNKKYKTKADMLWLWSPSYAPKLPSFYSRFKIDGSVVAGIDFMRGIAIAARMDTKKIPGATGYIDTNLKEKLKYAKNFLRYNDLVYIHVNSPDEESHRRDVRKKIQAIEDIDREIVGPMKEYLDKEFLDNYRIAILSDHHTLVEEGIHSNEPVPYLIFGVGIPSDSVQVFTENEVGNKSKIMIRSDEFMEIFLWGGRQ